MSGEPCLEFYRLRFTFRAVHPVVFPPGKPGNVLRGGFGLMLRALACEDSCREGRSCSRRPACAYTRLFEPVPEAPGPSGYSERARPFVFRAAHLDGSRIEPGQPFWFDMHLFETREPSLDLLRMTFAQLGREGLGAGRSRAELVSMQELDLRGSPSDGGGPLRTGLSPDGAGARRMRIQFVTPTELKSRDVVVPEPHFYVLLARARDRVSMLRTLNGAEPLDLDYKALNQRARAVEMTDCEMTRVEVARRSSRTGQRHSLGGFVGTAEYAGDLREFVPWIRAAQYCGVGRHTGWGNGEIRIVGTE